MRPGKFGDLPPDFGATFYHGAAARGLTPEERRKCRRVSVPDGLPFLLRQTNVVSIAAATDSDTQAAGVQIQTALKSNLNYASQPTVSRIEPADDSTEVSFMSYVVPPGHMVVVEEVGVTCHDWQGYRALFWRLQVGGTWQFDSQEISFAEVSKPMKLHGVAKADQQINVFVKNIDKRSATIAEFRVQGSILPYDEDFWNILTRGVTVCEEPD